MWYTRTGVIQESTDDREGIYSFLNLSQQSLQPKFLPTANKLHQLGFNLYATEATSQYLNEHNIPTQTVEWPLHSVGVNSTATRYTKGQPIENVYK